MNGVLRIIVVGSALVSPFLFPYPYSFALSVCASVFVPWLALAVGVLHDALFFVPDAGSLPVASMLGIAASCAALLVRRFVKARIITG